MIDIHGGDMYIYHIVGFCIFCVACCLGVFVAGLFAAAAEKPVPDEGQIAQAEGQTAQTEGQTAQTAQ